MFVKHRVVRAYQVVKTKSTITRHPRRKSKGIYDWGKTKQKKKSQSQSKSGRKQERLLQETMRMMRGRRAKYNATDGTTKDRGEKRFEVSR